jgi:CheY-like chemotaxis protein
LGKSVASEKRRFMRNRKILVIEDNALNMKLVRSLLKIGKFEILEAEDAESGIQLMRQHLPDLVLMDVQLPGMNGLKATRMIKRDPTIKEIPIVALTSYAMQGDEEKAAEAGCSGYITKPIDTKSFLQVIDKYICSNCN